MKSSKEFVQKKVEQGDESFKRRYQNISFKDGSTHVFKLVSDDVITIPVQTDSGQSVEKEGVEFTVEEDGTTKTFFTSSADLITKLSEKNPGDWVSVRMVRKKKSDGSFSAYYEVEDYAEQASDSDDDFPVVEDDEDMADEPF